MEHELEELKNWELYGEGVEDSRVERATATPLHILNRVE